MTSMQIFMDTTTLAPTPILHIRTMDGFEAHYFLTGFRPFNDESTFIDFMAHVKAGIEARYCWEGTALIPRSYFYARDSRLHIVCIPTRGRGFQRPSSSEDVVCSPSFQIALPITEQCIAELSKLEEL